MNCKEIHIKLLKIEQERFEDDKWVMIWCEWKENRKYNEEKEKRDKSNNNDIQNTTHKKLGKL
jgi:hypothetical protein